MIAAEYPEKETDSVMSLKCCAMRLIAVTAESVIRSLAALILGIAGGFLSHKYVVRHEDLPEYLPPTFTLNKFIVGNNATETIDDIPEDQLRSDIRLLGFATALRDKILKDSSLRGIEWVLVYSSAPYESSGWPFRSGLLQINVNCAGQLLLTGKRWETIFKVGANPNASSFSQFGFMVNVGILSSVVYCTLYMFGRLIHKAKRRRRLAADQCPECGYNITVRTNRRRCPECGAE